MKSAGKYIKLIFTILLGIVFSYQASAQPYSFIYIQGDKKIPFYIKLEGEMLPKYGKNYYVISQLPASTVNIDVIFPQNAYPAQHFIVQVPENGFREFTLAKTDNKFALYDLQQHFSLPAGNAEDEDHIPGANTISKIASGTGSMANKNPTEKLRQQIPEPNETATLSKKIVATPSSINTTIVSAANEPIFIENIELNNQHPIISPKKENSQITQPTQDQQFTQELKPISKSEIDKTNITPAAKPKITTNEDVPQVQVTKKSVNDQEAINEIEKHPYTRKVTISDNTADEENYHIVQIAQKPIEEKTEEHIASAANQQDTPVKGYYDDQGNFISEAPSTNVRTKPVTTKEPIEQNYTVQIAKQTIVEERPTHTSNYRYTENDGSTTEEVVTKHVGSNTIIDPQTHQPISTTERSGSTYEESYSYTKNTKPITTNDNFDQGDYIAENRSYNRKPTEETATESYKECTKPMDSYTFNELFKGMTQQDDPERKMIYVIKSINDHCFSTSQLRMLAQAMDNERRRFAILKKAYDRTTDKDNFQSLSSLFFADEWKSLFHQIMLQ
ncbi:MAG: DUF4476 domain-containing protein [Bacteroidota bacterium]